MSFGTALELVNHYQPELPGEWAHLLSQTNNRLANCVTQRSLTGKVTFVDQIGTLELDQKVGRMSPTNLSEVNTKRRAIYAKEYDKAIGFDEFDEIKLGGQSLPVAETMQKLREAYERKAEKVIIDALGGTAYEGEEGVTPITFPAGQIVPVTFSYAGGGGNVGLTYDKIARVRRLAMENEAYGQGIANGSDCLCMAADAGMIEDLYHDVKVNNRDYVTSVEKLRDGIVDDFLGIKIVRTEQLEKVVSGDTITQGYVWLKSRLHFGVRNNYSAKMSVRDDLSETIQIRVKAAIGASRIEESAVWQLPCKKTA